MNEWTIAAVQMDCQLADQATNLSTVRQRLREAADQGARLVVFPECALSGYGFAARAEAAKASDTLPGVASEALAIDCAKLNVFAVVGMLERDQQGKLFNCCALVGPQGLIAGYARHERLTSQDATEHANGGARISGIQNSTVFAQTMQAFAVNGDVGSIFFNFDSKRRHAGQSRVAVSTG